MNESEFNSQVDETLRHITAAIDGSTADIDCEFTAGGILTIEFGNGSQIIINRQGAAQEIWVAAKSGGRHFRWQDGAWRDSRDGSELLEALGRLVSEQAGAVVRLI